MSLNIKALPHLKYDSKIEKIRAHFLNDDVPLTKHEEELKERLESAFSLLCNYHSNEQAIPVLKKKFNISQAQAYRDIKNATDIFGDITQTKKEAARYILYELAMKNYQLAASKNPPDLEQMNRAVTNMIKIKGLDRDDIDMPDLTKIQPPVQILQINIDFLTSQFSNIIDEKAKGKINKLMNQIASIIDKNKINDYLDQHIEIPTINNALDNV